MGVNGDAKLEKADNRRAKQKGARSRRRGAEDVASFRERDVVPVVAAYIVATEGKGAIRLGITRDGGAYAIGMYAGEDYATEYIKPNEDWEDAWNEIIEAWFPEKREEYEVLKQFMRQSEAR